MTNELEKTRIFVFGSNLAGRHGKGAAKHALQKYGAVYGNPIGHMGMSYAIPTKDKDLVSLPLDQVEIYVHGFIAYAHTHPDLTFNVTQVGCGLAGNSPEDMVKLFDDAMLRFNKWNGLWFDPVWAELFKARGRTVYQWEGPL